MSDTAARLAEGMSKMLDPQWLQNYGDALKAISSASSELGVEGFKQLMELEKQRISMEADARIAEIKLTNKLELEKLRLDNDLRWERYCKTHRWFGLESSNLILLVAIFAAIAVAVLK